MSWIAIIPLAVVAFCVLAFVLKAPRKGWEAIGAALILGLAGYAWQGSPSLPGAPKAPVDKITKNPAALVDERRSIEGEKAPSANSWVVIADGLARHGQYGDAANILVGATEKDPHNAEAWLALANALVSHAEGNLSPASLLAFRRAAEAAPDQPGPPFFLGLALAQSGRLTEARALWTKLLKNTPPDAPWRADLEQRLSKLDDFIARQEKSSQRP